MSPTVIVEAGQLCPPPPPPPPPPHPPFAEEVDALARRLSLKFFRMSVKEDFNVEEGKHGLNLCLKSAVEGGAGQGVLYPQLQRRSYIVCDCL